MITTDTPRTDEVLMHCPSHLQEVALANLAQDLEAELAESQAEVERLRSLLRDHATYLRKNGFDHQANFLDPK